MKARKFIAALLIFTLCIGLSSCSLSSEEKASNEPDDYTVALAASANQVNYSAAYDAAYLEFSTALSDFSAELSEALYKGCSGSANTNICISPISIYMALALAVECSEGETRAEILNALGMSYEEISTHTKTLYALCNTIYKGESHTGEEVVTAFEELSNSVWLTDRVTINKNNAEKLAESFHTDVFSLPMGKDGANKAISEYIEDKTHGLIDGNIELTEKTAFVLLNTFYLKEVWNIFGNELKKTTESYRFNNSDGSIESLKLLEGNYHLGKVYEGENYTSFHSSTLHGYRLHVILPDEGVSAGEVFNEDTIKEIKGIKDYSPYDEEKMERHFTRLLFPEFEAEFDEEIKDVLKNNLGIKRLFSMEDAELSALISKSDFNLYCDRVIHRTKLKVDSKGIEGAAITAIIGNDGAAPPDYTDIYHDFTVDRAFGFILTDSYGTVLFSGVVNKIN